MIVPARLQPYLFALAASAALAAFVYFDLQRERVRSVEGAKVDTANLSRLLEAQVLQALRRVEQRLDQAQARAEEAPAAEGPIGASAALTQALGAKSPVDGLVRAMSWLAVDGPRTAVATWSDPAAVPSDAALQDWLARVRSQPARRLVLGKPVQQPDGRWVVPAGRTVAAAGGHLLALVDLQTLQPVFDGIDTGRNGFISLFLTDGWMLATSPKNTDLFARNWGTAPMFTEHLPKAPTGTVQQVVVRDGTERVYSYRALTDHPVVVSTGISMTDALADWRARARSDALLLALVTVIGLWGARAMSGTYARREVAERQSAQAARETQAIVDHAADGIVTYGADGRIESANPAALAMFGLNPSSVTRQTITALVPNLHATGNPAARTHSAARIGRRADGQEFPIEIAVTELQRDGRPLAIALIRDTTERRRAESAVAQARDQAQQSERFLREITDNLPLRIAYVDKDLRYRFVNQAHCQRFARPREEILGHTRQELSGQPLEEALRPRIDAVLAGQPQRFELEEMWGTDSGVVESYLVPDVGPDGQVRGFYAASSDVTERHAQQRRIERALAERETLLREVYHRVKNNLQVIQSLLNLQRRALPAGDARSALDDSVQRVQAMALVHEKLYQTGNLDAVALRDYVVDLLRHLGDSAGADRRGVTLHAEVDAIEASLELAVPFGLLVTELVGNSLKHAFPSGRTGSIRVGLHRRQGEVWLHVQDDGLGLPPGFALDAATSMGLQLASSLAGQLGGQLQTRNEAGALFEARLARMR